MPNIYDEFESMDVEEEAVVDDMDFELQNVKESDVIDGFDEEAVFEAAAALEIEEGCGKCKKKEVEESDDDLELDDFDD